MNRHKSIKRLFLLLISGLVISCADQKTEAAQNTIESDPVQFKENNNSNRANQKTESEDKNSPNGITTLVVTGNVHGQIDPCGWKKNPIGGLSRKSKHLKSLKAKGIDPLILDAGDLFFSKTTVSGISGEKAILKAQTMVDGYNILGCDVMNVGAKDFAKGIDFLRELEQTASFPFISSNIVNEKNGELPFAPYKILEKNGFRFGVVGLTAELSPITRGNLRADPFIERGKAVLSELDAITDIQIVLFNGSLDKAKIAREALTSADLLFVSGDTRNPARGGSEISTGTVMKQLGKQGKSLGVVSIDVVDIDLPLRDLSNVQNRLKFLDKQLKRYAKKDPSKSMEEIYADDEKMLNRVATIQDELEKLKLELTAEGNSIQFDFVPMNKKVGEDLMLLSIVNETLSNCDALGPDKTPSKQKKPSSRSIKPSRVNPDGTG